MCQSVPRMGRGWSGASRRRPWHSVAVKNSVVAGQAARYSSMHPLHRLEVVAGWLWALNKGHTQTTAVAAEPYTSPFPAIERDRFSPRNSTSAPQTTKPPDASE